MKKNIKSVIIPKSGSKPLGPYSPGIRVGDMVYTSGQIGLDPLTGKLVSGGLEAETHQALQNLLGILEATGSSLSQVVKVTIYLRNIEDYPLVNKIYAEYFQENPPARAIVEGKLPASASIEIDAIASIS